MRSPVRHPTAATITPSGAVALKAVLDQAKGLFTAGERALLGEFLDRLAAGSTDQN